MEYTLFSLPGHEVLHRKLLQHDIFLAGNAVFRRFPDSESYVRVLSDLRNKKVAILCSLHQPDEKAMMLYFLTQLARQLGATSVSLIAPYLGYMRQDKAFHPGEAVTSDLFAHLLSDWVDELVTIDPHLHRHPHLSDIYRIPAVALHAGPVVADYIAQRIPRPVLIGPDEESKQWVSAIADRAGCPYTVLKKERLGDREVRVTLPEPDNYRNQTPVLVDDIISTGRTMLETARHLQRSGIDDLVCIGIHGLFSGESWTEMKNAGIRTIATTNTVPHPTNALDISTLLAGHFEKNRAGLV